MESLKNFYHSFCTITNLRVVLGGLGIQLSLGYFYLWTPISAYITSYYRQKDQSLSNEFTNIIQPSLGQAKALVMPLAAMVSTFFGYRNTTIIFGFVLFLAFWHSSICHNFWWFFFDYSIIGGIVNGLLVMLPIYQIQKYFKQYKGVATGIVFSGYGLGSIIWSQFCYRWMNPNNIQAQIDQTTKKKFFPIEVSNNVPSGLTKLGLLFFISLTVSAYVAFIKVKDNPINDTKKEKEKKEEKEETKPLVSKQAEDNKKKEEKTYAQLILSKSYLAIVSMALLSSLFPMMIINNYKIFSLDYHNDDKYLTNVVVTASSIANGLARIVWGFIYDKIGFHFSFFINLIFQLMIILLFSMLAPFQIGFAIAVSLSFFCQGGTFLLFPLYIMEYFGYTDGQKVYGFVHYSFSIANFLQYYIMYYLKDKFGLQGVLVLFFAANSIACLVMLAFKQKKKAD